LIVGEVAGPLEPQALREAAYHCICKHPGLRARILPGGPGERPTLEYLPPDRSRVVVEVRTREDAPDGQPLWQAVMEQEAQHRFDMSAGYLLRVVWVPSGGGRGHLILNAPHALVDGISLMRLLHDVLEACAAVQAGRAVQPAALEPTPPALSYFKGGLWDSCLALLGKGFLARQQKAFPARCPFPIHRPLGAADEIETHCRFQVGAADNFRQVRRRCKEEGVTVGGAYSAAVQFASLRYIHQETGRLAMNRGRVSFPMSMDFSLRRLIGGGHVTQDAIGLFTGVADIGVSVPADITFWDLARRLMDSSKAQLKRRTPVLFQRVADRLYNLDRLLADRGIDHVATGGAGEAVNISNVGPYPYSVEYGPLRLEHVFGCNGAIKGGPMFIFWLRSINDHFCYNAMSAYPAADRAGSDRLFDGLVALVEGCGRAETDRLTLADYVLG
jgi:hypothetical protein